MRLTKLGWVGAMTLSSLIALPFAQAQDKKEGTAAPAAPAAPPAVGAPPAPGTPAAPRVSTPEQRAAQVEARVQGMTRTLTLTDDQKKKIRPIIEEEIKSREEMMQSVPPAERMKKFGEIRQASLDKIKPILTAEQLQKFESLRQRPTRRAETPVPPVAPPVAPAK
jgi:protein CpxP